MMKHLKLAGAAAVAALALGASGANAATYLLTQDGCTGGCLAGTDTSAGTVTTSVDGGSILVTVALNAGYTFHDTDDSQHHALVFDLPGVTSIDITNLSNTPHFTADGTQAAGTNSASPFGDFDYVVNFPKDNTHPVFSTLSFDITAPGLTLDSFGSTGGIFFATDINGNGNTGNVGALGGAVPEPATWAVMLLGFGGIGAAMRRSRRAAALA